VWTGVDESVEADEGVVEDEAWLFWSFWPRCE